MPEKFPNDVTPEEIDEMVRQFERHIFALIGASDERSRTPSPRRARRKTGARPSRLRGPRAA